MAFKSTRKRSGDGFEGALFTILKVKYDIKLQAYHGGTMTGKDIQKVMENASKMFTLFAGILKANRRPDSKYDSPEKIDELCNSFAGTFVLWDGAFSFASKIAPSKEHGILQYIRFVTAAVNCHVAQGCSVTPKVHLMWRHVADQMECPGGLVQKREDWVEHRHQITCKERVQFGKTNDKDVCAHAMARLYQ